MRSETEMLALILKYAQDNDDVRAVVMNGSRVNPNAPRDLFQDFDIIYFVGNVESYRRNWEVVRYFGEILILQTPDDMGDPPPQDRSSYCYLMQFMDGNRIDLTFYPLDEIGHCLEDSLTIVLLDKDNRIGELPPPHDYPPQRPTQKAFDDCCNEFWWVNPYVAKGLWRDELPYAKFMLDTAVREQLMKMLTWYCGIKTNFEKSSGKFGKYMRSYLSQEQWLLLEKTYAGAQTEHNWQALFAMGELFRDTAQEVARSFGFIYPDQEDKNVSGYIRKIKALPKDANEIS